MNKLKQTLSWVFGIVIGIFILVRIWIEVARMEKPDIHLPLRWEWLLGGTLLLIALIILGKLRGTTRTLASFFSWFWGLLKWGLIVALLVGGGLLATSNPGQKLLKESLFKAENAYKGGAIQEFSLTTLGPNEVSFPELEEGYYRPYLLTDGNEYGTRCQGRTLTKTRYFAFEERLNIGNPKAGNLSFRRKGASSDDAVSPGGTILLDKTKILWVTPENLMEGEQESCIPVKAKGKIRLEKRKG